MNMIQTKIKGVLTLKSTLSIHIINGETKEIINTSIKINHPNGIKEHVAAITEFIKMNNVSNATITVPEYVEFSDDIQFYNLITEKNIELIFKDWLFDAVKDVHVINQ